MTPPPLRRRPFLCRRGFLRALGAAAAWPVVLLAAGCDKSSPQSFRPDEDVARGALEAALTAWKSGQATPAPLKDHDPPVHIVDKVWESKAKLKNYEIQSAAETDTTKTFTVKLDLEKALAPQSVVYVVVGKSPVWVFREEDYKTGGGM
jgi:hypothetical protein